MRFSVPLNTGKTVISVCLIAAALHKSGIVQVDAAANKQRKRAAAAAEHARKIPDQLKPVLIVCPASVAESWLNHFST